MSEYFCQETTVSFRQYKEVNRIEYAGTFKINAENLIKLIISYTSNGDDDIYKYYNENDELEEMLSHTDLDKRFRKHFENELEVIIGTIANNSFENELRVGLNLLQSLLTAESPKIHVTHRRTPEKPKNEIVEEFSKVCENLPLREQVHLMTKIYEYEEKYNETL